MHITNAKTANTSPKIIATIMTTGTDAAAERKTIANKNMKTNTAMLIEFVLDILDSPVYLSVL